MLEALPRRSRDAMDWSWGQIAPYYDALAARSLSVETIAAWMADWSQLQRLLGEVGVRRHLAYDLNTADPEAERGFFSYIESIGPQIEAAEQRLKEKLLASGLEPDGLQIPLRNMRAEAALFREENLPLMIEETKLGAQYDKIVSAQMVVWQGQEIPLPQLRPILESADRTQRERAWWLIRERQLADRESLNVLWRQLFALRGQIAANAGYPDYRSYCWARYMRFDYTPADCTTFHDAIERVCVPAAARIFERHRRRLGLATLRPWDLANGEWSRPAPPPSQIPLKPYSSTAELRDRSAQIFEQIDPDLGDYFQVMQREELLDLENRKGKAPGAYCTYFAVERRPFILMNAVGTHDDVQVMLHEAGHAFHAFEKSRLPYQQQLHVPMEFNEVASMSIELLGGRYLTAEQGGFYSEADAARARIEHLEQMILFWPYMAVVDAFQHWAYTNPSAAIDTDACDAQWQALWKRFMPTVDWSGLEAERATGWHRKLHIFRVPFYYVEYGIGQLGAAHVWRNALADQGAAVRRYRSALALGGTAPLPQLFQEAGASFALDAETLGQVVALVERTLAELGT
jgi:oligoendopeptidase F